MKKWMYLIAPTVMLGAFMFLYLAESKEAEIKEKARAAEIAKTKALEAEKKKNAEEKARLDSAKRAAERAAEEAKREAEKIAKREAESKRIQDETDKYLAESSAHTRKITELESQLETARKSKDQASRESFDLLKQVERAKVERRNAEIEIARLTEMLARRASDSSMTRMPTPPPPAAK